VAWAKKALPPAGDSTDADERATRFWVPPSASKGEQQPTPASGGIRIWTVPCTGFEAERLAASSSIRAREARFSGTANSGQMAVLK
jgi:hypothetical protein